MTHAHARTFTRAHSHDTCIQTHTEIMAEIIEIVVPRKGLIHGYTTHTDTHAANRHAHTCTHT